MKSLFLFVIESVKLSYYGNHVSRGLLSSVCVCNYLTCDCKVSDLYGCFHFQLNSVFVGGFLTNNKNLALV